MNKKMLSQEEIRKNLLESGFKEQELGAVTREVDEAIIRKIFSEYFSSLTTADREKIKNMTSDKLAEFIESKKEDWPKLSQEEFEKMYDDNWEDYFKAISGKN